MSIDKANLLISVRKSYLYCRSGSITYALARGRRLDAFRIANNSRQTYSSGESLNHSLKGLGLSRMQKALPVTAVLDDIPVMAKLLAIPRVDEVSRDLVLKTEFAEVCPIPLENVSWSTLTLTKDEIEEQVLIAFTNREIVDRFVEGMKGHGLRIKAIHPAAFCLMRLFKDSGHVNFCLIHCQSGGAHMIAAEGASICIRTPRMSEDKEGAPYLTELRNEIIRFIRLAKIRIEGFEPEAIWVSGLNPILLDDDKLLGVGITLRSINDFEPFTTILTEIDSKATCCNEELSPLIAAIDGNIKNESKSCIDFLPREYHQAHIDRIAVRKYLLAGFCILCASVIFAISEWSAAGKLEGVVAQWIKAVERHELIHEKIVIETAREQELMRQIELLQTVESQKNVWVKILTELQQSLSEVEDVWLDSWQRISEAGNPSESSIFKVGGRMVDRENPLAHASDRVRMRVQTLFEKLSSSPSVLTISDKRFDTREQGILRFSFLMELDVISPP